MFFTISQYHGFCEPISDLPPQDVDRVQIGSRVEVFFDDLPDTEVTLPRFRLT